MSGDEIDIAGLLGRLEAAERVCALYSYVPARFECDEDKALHELWREWHASYGHLVVRPVPLAVAELAIRRDLTREQAVRRMREFAEGAAAFKVQDRLRLAYAPGRTSTLPVEPPSRWGRLCSRLLWWRR